MARSVNSALALAITLERRHHASAESKEILLASHFFNRPRCSPGQRPSARHDVGDRVPEDTYDSDCLGITFSSRLIADPAGGLAIPPGPALSLAQARAISDARLSAMSPDERAEAVSSVCRSIAPLRARLGSRSISLLNARSPSATCRPFRSKPSACFAARSMTRA